MSFVDNAQVNRKGMLSERSHVVDSGMPPHKRGVYRSHAPAQSRKCAGWRHTNVAVRYGCAIWLCIFPKVCDVEKHHNTTEITPSTINAPHNMIGRWTSGRIARGRVIIELPLPFVGIRSFRHFSTTTTGPVRFTSIHGTEDKAQGYPTTSR